MVPDPLLSVADLGTLEHRWNGHVDRHRRKIANYFRSQLAQQRVLRRAFSWSVNAPARQQLSRSLTAFFDLPTAAQAVAQSQCAAAALRAVRWCVEFMPTPGLVVSELASNFEHGNEAGN